MRRLITLDTETKQTAHNAFISHHLRCWVARLDDRDPDHLPVTSATYAYGTDRASVVDQVESWTRSGQTTWLYAHNLAFDATVTDLPMELVRRGWQITSSNIIDSPVWFRLRRGNRRLVLADSHGVWPCSLQTIAQDMGMSKAELPADDDMDMSGWWERCESDVTILATALLHVLNYWDEHQLGRWAVTGSGSGWSAFRTHFITEKILIDIDDTAMRFEQRCTYGGRREAYRLGEWPRGEFIDYDFRAAYPSIVSIHDVPVRRLSAFDSMDTYAHQTRKPNFGVIAECVIKTAVPVVPVRYGESIFYPVGEFKTVLASPEIDLVTQTGGHVTIGHGYSYALGPAMRRWGEWITGLIGPERPDVPAVVRRQAKHWSRAVIGRWTMRLSREVDLPGFPTTGQRVVATEWLDYDPADVAVVDGLRRALPGAVPTSRVKGYQVLFGDRYYALVADQWPENGFPAIWAYVESWCRRSLWEAMQAAGPDQVWQCDTDGYLVGRTARTATRKRSAGTPVTRVDGTARPLGVVSTRPTSVSGLRLVVKGEYSSARIIGPQHTVLGGQRRFPGIPRTAVETARDTFQAETWPGFLAQVEGSPAGEFRTRSVTVKVKAGLNPRWTLRSGRTLPVEFSLVDGRNAICQPPRWTATGGRVVLDEMQHAILSRITRS